MTELAVGIDCADSLKVPHPGPLPEGEGAASGFPLSSTEGRGPWGGREAAGPRGGGEAAGPWGGGEAAGPWGGGAAEGPHGRHPHGRSTHGGPSGGGAPQEATVVQRYVRFQVGQGRLVDEPVIAEMRLAILVDGQEIVQLMCSPRRVSALVLGFLYHEGIIESYDDVLAIRVCLPDGLAEVRLARPLAKLPERRIITSGCTGGVSFGAYLDELDALRLPPDDVRAEPGLVYGALRALQNSAELYRRSGGVHTSILVDPRQRSDEPVEVLAVGEDIGRHNTIDKLRGETLLRGVDPAGGMILASGRISSEMLLKAALMRTPIVGSRTSPTQLAVTLAERLGLTVIGYIRSASMNVYTHPWRVVGAPAS